MDNQEFTNYIKFFLDNVLTNNTSDYPKNVEDRLEVYRRNRISKPVIYIGVTSSSVCAGALNVKSAIEEYITDNQFDISVITTGSLGLCSHEPLIDIQIPGKNRVVFSNVSTSDIQPILDGILTKFLPIDKVLGQYRHKYHEPWQEVPFLDELPFFKEQNRIILSNCGVIDPCNIFDYMARGGYRALAKSLRNHTYEEICSIVEQSG